MKRAALYLRVSTDEQTVDNQRPELDELARRRGFDVVAVFEETASGGLVKRRHALERLIRSAARHEFDAVLVWALDRLGRTMAHTVAMVLELDRTGVEVLSAREPWLDTAGPVRPLLVSVFAWVAEQERARAGLARARAQGTRLGRPRAPGIGSAVQLVSEGMSVRAAAAAVGASEATVRRALKA